MAKNIHIHLPALLKKPVSKVRDAQPSDQIMLRDQSSAMAKAKEWNPNDSPFSYSKTGSGDDLFEYWKGKSGRIVLRSEIDGEGRKRYTVLKYKESAKDAGNKFVTKVDIRLPKDDRLDRRSGGILPRGTVVYKEGAGYRPWFIKNDLRLQLDPKDLVSGDIQDASAPEWAEFRRETWEKLEVGKTYKIAGRSGTVMKKSENPGSGNRTGGGNPMALIKWKDAKAKDNAVEKRKFGSYQDWRNVVYKRYKRVSFFFNNGTGLQEAYPKDSGTGGTIHFDPKSNMGEIHSGANAKDADFTTYDPREAKRLDDEIKEVEAKIKITKGPFAKKDLEQVLEKLKRERAKYRS